MSLPPPDLSLQGPFPLDPGNVDAGLREALDAAEAGPAAPWSRGERPGLYLVWAQGEGEPRLVGLWLTLGPSWLAEGRPEREEEPPLVRAVLDGLTEAVWWRRLPTGDKTRWRLPVVLEWPPALAERSAVAPPGAWPATVAERRVGDFGGDGGFGADVGESWLDAPLHQGPGREATPAPTTGRGGGRRSLVTVVACQLEVVGGRHRGRFAVVVPTGGAPKTWLMDPGTPPEEDAAAGALLSLPGDRSGHALDGWLGRELELCPAVGPAVLAERDIGSRLLGQLRAAGMLTAAVLAVVLAVGVAVQLASTPEVRAALRVPEPAAQPAMSLCSVDHQPFVDALRCEVATAGGLAAAGCGDAGAPGPAEDLQATWCGLRDRPDDARERFDHAHLAAAQACYRVLGAPWSYRLDPDSSGPGIGDPDRFLRDPALAIAGLQEAVAGLDGACDRAGGRLEARVEGAILATLVGGAGDEAAALRGAVLEQAGRGRSAEERRCLASGAAGGALASRDYLSLCGDDEALESPAWAALGGRAPDVDGVAQRYADARFGGQAPVAGLAPDLWACHSALAAGGGGGRLAARWDQSLPVPSRYGSGLVASQLQLEAGLLSIVEDGLDPGPCWRLAARALQTWPTAHPLLGGADQGWPSEEQQLCGQVCAVSTGLRAAEAGAWLTPGTDLGRCVDPAPPVAGDGTGSFDRLRLPWNGTPRVSPRAEQVCAFHLVGQGWLGAAAGPLLVDAAPPPLWAGETSAGSRIAGGAGGAAVTSAESLGTYGRARSRATCGHVAAQCFAVGVVDVVGDPRLDRWQWAERWRAWVADLPTKRADQLAAEAPWCARIQPYLSAEGGLPEGELDYPCTKGIDEVRQAFGAELDALARSGGTR